MAAYGSQRRFKPSIRPAKYSVHIDRFVAYESEASVDYPESAFFLRFWHPLYEDFVDLTPGDLSAAKKGGIVNKDIVFKRPRASLIDRREVEIPTNAIMGVILYAKSNNDNKQLCIKQNGVAKPELSYWKVHSPRGFDGKVEFQSVHLASEVRGSPKTQSLSKKGYIDRLVITCTDPGHLITKPYSGSNAFISNPELFKSSMCGTIRDVYTPTFTQLRKPRIPKIKDYYAPQYVTANGDVLPISAYMIRTCMPDTMYPTKNAYLRAFRACLDQRPELGGESEFIRISDQYLESNLDDPSLGVLDDRRKWFTCMEIVASMTCIFNNAVPYLMDMERIGKDPMTPSRTTVFSPGSRECNKMYVEVERMVDAEKDYAHDCEDSSMNADMRKRGMGVFRDHVGVLGLVGRIADLFVSFVDQMSCMGNDAQIIKDDSIFHFCAMLIPRAYHAKMEANGKIPVNMRRPIIGSPIRKWEYAYKVGYDAKTGIPHGHIGVMYAEGTNTVCPSQFCYDVVVDSARTSAAQFIEGTVSGAMGEVMNWMNIYHANVFRDPSIMSSFYKYLICALSGDGPHHKEHGIYDYLFIDMSGPSNTYGVQVEMLARGNDKVGLALIPKMQYNKVEIEAIESHFTFRSMPYGVFRNPLNDPVDGKMKPMVGLDVDSLVKGIPGIRKGIPPPNPERPIDRYHYIRITPLDVDMQNPLKRDKIIESIRNVLAKGGDRLIRGVHVSRHLVQYVPMEPNEMNGPKPLSTTSVIIAFNTSCGVIGALRRLL